MPAMAARRRTTPPPSPLLLLFLLISTPPTTSAAASFLIPQLHNVISLSHTLFTRVANLRATRGDIPGSRRARLIAENLERGLGLGFLNTLWSLGWDYIRNYAWRESINTASFLWDLEEVVRLLGELSGVGTDAERAAWVGRNYGRVGGLLKGIFRRLSAVFSKQGPLKELVETLQREFEGDLLRDCLELGVGDLKGLIQILKDMASQYAFASKQDL